MPRRARLTLAGVPHHIIQRSKNRDSGYKELGSDPIARRVAYRELFYRDLDAGLVDRIRNATNGNFALGSERFSRQVQRALERRVTPAKSGRPRRNAADGEPR